MGVDPPEMVEVEGFILRVISVNHLMMDRLMQTTDGTFVTWHEALALTIAAKDRIDWTLIGSRCTTAKADDLFFRDLPAVLGRITKHLTRQTVVV